MSLALATLCIAAVAFLLRVLVALVKEELHVPRRTEQVHFAKFTPSQSGGLIRMSIDAPERDRRLRAGQRVAI